MVGDSCAQKIKNILINVNQKFLKMKKLILGLCFTVGACAMGLAKNGEVEVFLQKGKVADCIIVNVVRIYDDCGNEIGSNVVPTAGYGEQCKDAENRMVVHEFKVKVDGCREETN